MIGAVNGSHIPIIVPLSDPVSYYCRNDFYLLSYEARLIVNVGFGITTLGGILFQNSDIGGIISEFFYHTNS